MNIYKTKLLLIILLISGCHNVPVWKYDIFERPPNKGNYSELFLKGWRDGCESGAEASANYLYRLKYKFKQDWKLIENKEYITGWEHAYNFCRKYVFQNNIKEP